MKKILIGLAGLTFTAAIALGVYTHQTRITDSTLLANIAALSNDEDYGYDAGPAEGESDGSSGSWHRTDSDCVTTFTGSANSTITVTILGVTVTGKCDSNGNWTHTIKGGSTDCKSGGNQQCKARYCGN